MKNCNKSVPLINSTVYIVGDSTVSAFSDGYYLPRYGYGTQLERYLNLGEGASVVNLALSGRSSQSFLSEPNYRTLCEGIKRGDFLIIGFGHNDEKAEEQRYTNPNLSAFDSTLFSGRSASMRKILYDNYIKLALNAGATPVLCTPIVRLNADGDYSGTSGHITKNSYTSRGLLCAGGDYPLAIRLLAAETGVTLVDLTALTKADYVSLGFDGACDYHAFTSVKDGKRYGLDGSHTNLFGAMTNAYYIASTLKNSLNPLGRHVKENLKRPLRDEIYPLAINGSYRRTEYSPFSPERASKLWKTEAEGWYATVFGDVGDSSEINSQNFSFTVPKAENNFEISAKRGKIGETCDGLAAVFRQVPQDINFEISATAVTENGVSLVRGAGFGIMLRDDIHIDRFDNALNSGYVAAGAIGGSDADVVFCREGGKLKFSGNRATLRGGESHLLKIRKTNQTLEVNFDGYFATYTDFDFRAVDSHFAYICLFVAGGLKVEFKDVVFIPLGLSARA